MSNWLQRIIGGMIPQANTSPIIYDDWGNPIPADPAVNDTDIPPVSTAPPPVRPKRNVGGIIGGMLNGAIDAGATQNVALGGPTDMFRAMQAAQEGGMAREDRQFNRGIQQYNVGRQRQNDQYLRNKDERDERRLSETTRHNQGIEKNVADANKIREEAAANSVASTANKQLFDYQKEGLGHILQPGEQVDPQRVRAIGSGPMAVKWVDHTPEEQQQFRIKRGVDKVIKVPQELQELYGGEQIVVPAAEFDNNQKLINERYSKTPGAIKKEVEAAYTFADHIYDPVKQADKNKTAKAMVDAFASHGDVKGAIDALKQSAGRQEAAQIKVNVSPNNGAANDAKDIASAIMNGDQPPDMKGLYRFGGPVKAELARKGYDLTTAQRDWQAVQRHISTLNGPQQERLRQAVTFTYDSLDNIEQLYARWVDVSKASGVRLLNKANLITMKNLPGEAGAIANALEAQINDLTSELGTVYKGGNSSTDESLKLAAQNLRADWNPETFKLALQNIRKNLTIRKNSILNSEPAGLSNGSRFGSATTPAAPNGSVVVEEWVRENGKLVKKGAK